MHRLAIILTLLAFVLVSCGSPDASTPEKTVQSFFEVYQDKDSDAIKLLLAPNFLAEVTMICGENATVCIDAELDNEDPVTFFGTPQVSIVEQTDISTQVQLRHTTANSGATCSFYTVQKRGEKWGVNSVRGYTLCQEETLATIVAQNATSTASAQADAATLQAYELIANATATVQSANATASAETRAATAQAYAAADNATATTRSGNATATQQAIPTETPEQFLTARQALQTTNLSDLALQWSNDARLIEVAFNPDRRQVETDDIALDGTSRVWTFRYASPKLGKTVLFATRDGILIEQSENSAADYKTYFAGKDEPVNIDLDQLLDSDQALTIARENGLDVNDMKDVRMYLSTIPDYLRLKRQTSGAYWNIFENNFLSDTEIIFRADSGEIEINEFGPTGNPGAIPTPIAPAGKAIPTIQSLATATTVLSPSGATPTENAATKQAFLDYFQAQGVTIPPDDAVVEGDYVRSIAAEAGAIVFYKRNGDTWELLAGGSFFDSESLQKLGIPESLWP